MHKVSRDQSYLFLLLNWVEDLTTLILPIALITHPLSLQTAKMCEHYLMLGTSIAKDLTTRSDNGVYTIQ